MKYKAIKNGVLSNPYRRVREGDVVTLGGEVKATWLVPLESYKPEPEKPTVPHMEKRKPAPTDVGVGPAPASENYDNAMESIKKSEAAQDGLTEVKPGKFVGEAKPIKKDNKKKGGKKKSGKKKEGTGNQDVLG